MGDIKKVKKKYLTPRKLWDKERLHNEIVLIGKYGLRNKRELWRAQAILRNFRKRARKAMALPQEEREKQRKEIVSKLYRWGILPLDATLDDVLALTVESFLERRLQTIIAAKGLAKSIYQARQLIVHGHIAVAGRRVTRPSYIVNRWEENMINYASTSPLKSPDHPVRKALVGS
ncbi:MAG: 30S ribosomal protein S4 [Candidatus Freyarchaeota archaeon]|nr:30S ribosomal protein S4 [Candidatus Jordarchaeia archaeon]